jgi:hypothetical protein
MSKDDDTLAGVVPNTAAVIVPAGISEHLNPYEDRYKEFQKPELEPH